jgi:hypothetical protein
VSDGRVSAKGETDLDDGRVEQLDFFLNEVVKVPEAEGTAVLDPTGNELITR